jgi:rod shape-determining protein MreC
MQRSPPPFFKHGPSALTRVVFYGLVSIALLVLDTRYAMLETLRLGVGTALYPLQRALLIPRDALAMAADFLTDIERLRRENTELRRVEAANAKTLLQAEEIGIENTRLRALLQIRERVATRSVVAEVLYDARDPFSRKLVIDKGLQHGVVAGEPVIDANGVIGQVSRVFPLSAEVTAVTDPAATIPVQIQRTGLRAVAFGAGATSLELRYLSNSAELRAGDTVVTSGLDGLYPAGLPVGRVAQIKRGESGFSRVMLDPAAGIDQSKLLLVLLVDRNRQPAPPALEPGPESGKRRARN